MESAYLKKCFGNSLTLALAEVAKVRPSDPIEYLAHWLYRYRRVTRAKEKDRQEKIQLKEEYESRLREAEMTEMLKQEEYQIQVESRKCDKDQLSTAVSSQKTPALQEDTGSLKGSLKEASRQEPLPSISSVNLLSEPSGQTDFSVETPQEIHNQEASPQEGMEEMSLGSNSP